MSDRSQPTRAGVINVWDYVDEEWVFADGRLALRGHNGSGKTKALEVLFPFVLDGSLDARRLDPFSGENRKMKAHLLYRGQDAEHGYVWMEFARPGETVTLVVGLAGHKNRDRPRPSFYVTGKRMGVDFGLLSADSRPLTAKQLTAVLGRDAHYGDRKGAYQDAVDARMFGLGRERYTQLLDLLIALRRPLLAKDLDPAKVSDTLTAGLSPVDEDLVEQAARDFENLAAGKLADVGRAADRHARNLAEAADLAGLTSGSEPADSGADLGTTAKARVTQRRDDIREIRAGIALVHDAERDRATAETGLGKVAQALENREQSLRTAEKHLRDPRADAAARLGSWAGRWSGDEMSAVVTADQIDALGGALARTGEPDVPTLSELFTTLTQNRTTALITRAEQLRSRANGLAEQQAQKAGQRKAIADSRVDAPPDSDLRPADRAARACAPR